MSNEECQFTMNKQNSIFFGIKEKWANLSHFCKIFLCTIPVILILRYLMCIHDYTPSMSWDALTAISTTGALIYVGFTYHRDTTKHKIDLRNSRTLILYDNMFRYFQLMESRAKETETHQNIIYLHKCIVDYFSNPHLTCEQLFNADTLKKLHDCCSWRRVMNSWFKFANKTLEESDELGVQDNYDVKINFWHLMTREERIVSFFQTFLCAGTHSHDLEEVERLFKGTHLIHKVVTLLDDQPGNNEEEKKRAREMAVELNTKYMQLKNVLLTYRPK